MIPDRDGAWTWHQDPRAYHHDGQTIIGYIDSDGSVRVYSYDHDADEAFERPLNTEFVVDDHASPVVFRRSDGNIIAFYGVHNGPDMRFRISKEPDDITSWSAETIIDGGLNYPNPVELSDGSMFIWFRSGTGNQHYYVSDDGGESWDDGHVFTLFADRTYLKTAKDDDRIWLTIHHAPDDDSEQSFYVVYIDDGEVYDYDGTYITAFDGDTDLTTNDMSAVFESSDEGHLGTLRVWDVIVVDDEPRVLFIDVRNDSEDHICHEARLDGSAWDINEIVNSGGSAAPDAREYYSGGLCYDGSDADAVYLSRESGDTHEINRATTGDGGETWDLTSVTDESEDPQWRPLRVHDAHDDLPVVWLEQHYFQSFNDYEQTAVSELESDAQPPGPAKPIQFAMVEEDGDRRLVRVHSGQ